MTLAAQNELCGAVGSNGVDRIGQVAPTECHVQEPRWSIGHEGIEEGVRRLADGMRVVGKAFTDIPQAPTDAPCGGWAVHEL